MAQATQMQPLLPPLAPLPLLAQQQACSSRAMARQSPAHAPRLPLARRRRQRSGASGRQFVGSFCAVSGIWGRFASSQQWQRGKGGVVGIMHMPPLSGESEQASHALQRVVMTWDPNPAKQIGKCVDRCISHFDRIMHGILG